MSELQLVRKEFVKQVLQEEGKELHDNQGKAIAKLLHFHSEHLYEDRPYSVEADGAMDGKFTISIPGLWPRPRYQTKKQEISAQ